MYLRDTSPGESNMTSRPEQIRKLVVCGSKSIAVKYVRLRVSAGHDALDRQQATKVTPTNSRLPDFHFLTTRRLRAHFPCRWMPVPLLGVCKHQSWSLCSALENVWEHTRHGVLLLPTAIWHPPVGCLTCCR